MVWSLFGRDALCCNFVRHNDDYSCVFRSSPASLSLAHAHAHRAQALLPGRRYRRRHRECARCCSALGSLDGQGCPEIAARRRLPTACLLKRRTLPSPACRAIDSSCQFTHADCIYRFTHCGLRLRKSWARTAPLHSNAHASRASRARGVECAFSRTGLALDRNSAPFERSGAPARSRRFKVER